MKRHSFPAALAWLVGTVALAAIGATGGTASAHSLHDLEGRLMKQEPFVQIMDEAAPPFTLRDATGRTVRLADFRGKVVVLWFVYLTCTDDCPLHTAYLAQIQESVNATPMRDLIEFVAITTDPEHDTPEMMAAYGATHGLDPANGTILTSGPGDPAATRALAAEYRVKFAPTPDGGQMHGVVTNLIDKSGRLRARYHGLGFDATNMILHLNALGNDDH